VKALADNVERALRALGARVYGIEGQATGDWVLVDLGDIVVHVMHPAVRSHYNLEEIWGAKPVKMASAAKVVRGKAAARRARR
jgi:ribosome-associated protein